MSFINFWKFLSTICSNIASVNFSPLLLGFQLHIMLVLLTDCLCLITFFCFLFSSIIPNIFPWPIFQFTDFLFSCVFSSLNPPNEFLISITEIISSTVSIWFFSAKSHNFIFYIFEHIKHVYLKIFVNTSIVWIPCGSVVSLDFYLCFFFHSWACFFIEYLKLDTKNNRENLKVKMMLAFLQKEFIFASDDN